MPKRTMILGFAFLLTSCCSTIKRPIVTPISGRDDVFHVQTEWIISCPSNPDEMKGMMLREPTKKEARAWCRWVCQEHRRWLSQQGQCKSSKAVERKQGT